MDWRITKPVESNGKFIFFSSVASLIFVYPDLWQVHLFTVK